MDTGHAMSEQQKDKGLISQALNAMKTKQITKYQISVLKLMGIPSNVSTYWTYEYAQQQIKYRSKNRNYKSKDWKDDEK